MSIRVYDYIFGGLTAASFLGIMQQMDRCSFYYYIIVPIEFLCCGLLFLEQFMLFAVYYRSRPFATVLLLAGSC